MFQSLWRLLKAEAKLAIVLSYVPSHPAPQQQKESNWYCSYTLLANWLQLRKTLVSWVPCLFKRYIKARLSESKSKLQTHISDEFSPIQSFVCRHSSRHDIVSYIGKLGQGNSSHEKQIVAAFVRTASENTHLSNNVFGLYFTWWSICNKEPLKVRVYWTAKRKCC